MNKTLLALLALTVLFISACAQTPSELPKEDPCTSNDPDITIIAKGEQCALIKFACAPEYEPFHEECGCGCKPIKQSAPAGKIQVTDCTEEQKQNKACTREYLPVCGWSDPAKIQCIRYPCASTFGNKCEACANENVISWSEGECPTG